MGPDMVSKMGLRDDMWRVDGVGGELGKMTNAVPKFPPCIGLAILLL